MLIYCRLFSAQGYSLDLTWILEDTSSHLRAMGFEFLRLPVRKQFSIAFYLATLCSLCTFATLVSYSEISECEQTSVSSVLLQMSTLTDCCQLSPNRFNLVWTLTRNWRLPNSVGCSQIEFYLFWTRIRLWRLPNAVGCSQIYRSLESSDPWYKSKSTACHQIIGAEGFKL